MDHVLRQQVDVHDLVDRHVQVVGEADFLLRVVRVGVSEFEPPLMPDDVHRERALIRRDLVVEGRQHRGDGDQDEQDGRPRRPREFHRGVAFDLLRQPVRAAAAELDYHVDNRALDEHEHHRARSEDQPEQVELGLRHVSARVERGLRVAGVAGESRRQQKAERRERRQAAVAANKFHHVSVYLWRRVRAH